MSNVLPSEIQGFLDRLMPAFKQNLKQYPMLAPCAFIFEGEKFSIVQMDTTDEASKDFSARQIRKFCKEVMADAVITVTESWSLDGDGAMDYMKNRSKYRSVSEHPLAFEVVSFAIETHESEYGGFSKILPGREMGEPEFIRSTHTEGRFTRFLGPRLVKN